MKYWLPFIFSLGFLAAGAQDSLTVKPGSGPEFWLDYGKVTLYATSFESKLEGALTWRFGKVAPIIAGGYSELNPEQAIKNGEFIIEGWYIRGGLEYYMSLNRKNRFIVGGRYGYASFSENGSYLITSDLWPDETGSFEREGLTATWAELVLGSEMTLGESRFMAGGYFSLRVLINREEFEPVDSYAIPGYGRTIDKTIPALQLYIKFSLAR